MAQAKTQVNEPCDSYDSLVDTWKKCRAFAHSQQYVKDADILPNAKNYLLPFSPTMSLEQYAFFKAEAELPGITSQFISVVIGGLLRKPPQIEYKKEVSEEAMEWIKSDFTVEGGSLIAFLDKLLNEEMQTSRAWIYVDYPMLSEEQIAAMDSADFKQVKPYAVIWQAENVINWQTTTINGKRVLSRIIVRGYVDKYLDPLAFHPYVVDTIWVHELIDNAYQIRVFELEGEANPVLIEGQTQPSKSSGFKQVSLIQPRMHGELMTTIPAYPANGNIDAIEPYITTFVDKEQALYNVMSRRNHLLYGAATYTPWVASDMPDEDFTEIVNQGLGTWIRLRKGDEIGSLSPPTEALKDLESAIASKMDELAKLGIRFLAPETAESGVALTIRSAAQVATLGTLNTKLSEVVSGIIVYMLNRRYDLGLTNNDVIFTLSPDFDPTAIGQDYIRLMTEIYKEGLIPRSEWLRLLKANELLSPEYNDDEAQDEINEDENIVPSAQKYEDGLNTASKLAAKPPAK